MRARCIAATLLFIAATAAGAEHAQRLSLIVNDPVRNEHTATGTTWSGELALEYSYGVTSRLSLDGRIGYERRLDYFYSLYRNSFPPSGTRIAYWERRVTTRPRTALATFRGNSLGRFTPRISAGVRQVRAPIRWYLARALLIPERANTPHGDLYPNRTSAQAILGGDIQVTRRFALRVDLARLLRHDRTPYDPRATATLGAVWRMR